MFRFTLVLVLLCAGGALGGGLKPLEAVGLCEQSQVLQKKDSSVKQCAREKVSKLPGSSWPLLEKLVPIAEDTTLYTCMVADTCENEKFTQGLMMKTAKPQNIHRLTPLVKFYLKRKLADDFDLDMARQWLFKHEPGSNPYCAIKDTPKFAQVVQYVSRQLAALNAPAKEAQHDESTKKYLNMMRSMIDHMTRALLLADCEQTEATSAQQHHTQTFWGPKSAAEEAALDPVLRNAKKVLSFVMRHHPDRLNHEDHHILAQLQDIITQFTAEKEVNLETLYTTSMWRPLMQKMRDIPDDPTSGPYAYPLFPPKIEEFKSPRHDFCECETILEALGFKTLQALPQINFNLGTLKYDKKGNLESHIYDREDPFAEGDVAVFNRLFKFAKVDKASVANVGRNMAFIQMSEIKPANAAKYLLWHTFRSKALEGEGGGQMCPGSQTKVALIVVPILQNVMMQEYRHKKDISDQYIGFSKKMRWFFVLNIVWAVFHQIELLETTQDELIPSGFRSVWDVEEFGSKVKNHQNIIMGLYVTVFAMLNRFAYNGVSISGVPVPGAPTFEDWYIGTYTHWNSLLFETIMDSQRGFQMNVLALAAPILESIANHGSINHWYNYRRDHLMHSIFEVFSFNGNFVPLEPTGKSAAPHGKSQQQN